MPYSRNSELPKAVRQTVPEEKHTQFRRVFNSVYADTKSEQRAFASAWSAVEKRQMDEDLFTNPAEARTRARMMGLGEEIHTHFMNGQAFYMPAATHEAYMEYYNELGDIEDKEEPDDLLSRILTAIIQEITKVDMSTLESKASDHNKKHGGKGKVTASTLRQVYDRGIGAYKTNPCPLKNNGLWRVSTTSYVLFALVVSVAVNTILIYSLLNTPCQQERMTCGMRVNCLPKQPLIKQTDL
jgi:cation transport regulator ChaB